MSRWLAARSLLFGLTLLLFGGLPATTRSQNYKPTPAALPQGEPMRLPEDVPARQRLAAAHDYVKAHSWPKAVRLLQALLDSKTDSFHRVVARDRHGKTSQRWMSVRVEAEELLANLPAEGMDFYLATYEAAARKELAATRARHDQAALHDLARRYRHTKAGREALEELGSYHLDRGHAELADACFQQLLRSPGAERVAPLTLFKTVLAAHLARAANVEATPAWRTLVERMGEGGLRIGEETYRIDKIREVIAAWPGGDFDNYPLFRGDPARSARVRGDAFLLQPQRRLDTAEGETRQWIAQASTLARRLPLSAATPLGLEGKIIYRGGDGLHALDANSGRPLWHRPSLLSLASILNNSGQKIQLKNWLRLYGADGAALVENGVLGTLSGDDRHVYAIEDMPLPPHPSLLQSENGPPTSLGPLRYFIGSNTLRALDLDNGNVLWEIGGPAARNPKADPHVSDAHFLGPPLPLGQQLFAVVEKQQEASLVCLDAEHGMVRWTQMLATARDPLSLNVVRHTQAVHLAYAEGVLVCPTHSGVLVGVDPLSRSLLWAYVYVQPPTVREDGMLETPTAPLRSDWKGAAPIVDAGLIVFTPPDSEAIYCLHLHDGSLAWKVTRTDDDLYVACVHKGCVLLVGRSACLMLRLDTGEVLWRQPSGEPAGQGVAAGSLYYLPQRGGGILAVNLDRPRESIRLDSPSPRRDLGNLLFHRGVLWAQSASTITALTPLTTQLARLDQRLARAPRDPSLLFERGRLHLDRGDLHAAVVDLHDALKYDVGPAPRSAIRERLFVALTQLLQHDFVAAEKYLDSYRTLCRPPIPPSANAGQRAVLEKERERRYTHYLDLVALGREKQNRLAEAIQAYRQLSRRSDELMTVPDEPGLRTRPDLWVGKRVATLLAHASPSQRQPFVQWIRREGQALAGSHDRAALRRYLALFGGIEGAETSIVAEVRLHLARQLAHASEGRHALEAEFLLRDLFGDDESKRAYDEKKRSSQKAIALHEHALLLTRRGLLAEALTDYRRLAREHAGDIIHESKTCAQLLDDLRIDKRFLPYVETPSDPWKEGKFRSTVVPSGLALPSFRAPCVPCRHLPQGEMRPFVAGDAMLDPMRELPEWCRGLRFTVDGLKLQLQVADRASGAELYRIPLPLPSVPASLLESEIPFQAVNHLLVLCVGPTLVGVDVFQRRVCWSRNVLDRPASLWGMTASGGILTDAGREGYVTRLGLVGPIGPSAICIHTRDGLTALDPTTGDVRWTRDDVGRSVTVFGDDHYLFLVEQPGGGDVRSVRAVRAYDGVSVAIPDAVAACANRRRILGRLLLVAETPPDGPMNLRLHDPLTGKDVWKKTVRAGSRLLSSPQSRWLGILEPDGAVVIVDQARGGDVARLHLEPRHLRKLRNAYLLADRRRFYVALQTSLDPALKMTDDPNPNFRSGLASLPVNGPLYAFDRDRSALAWTAMLPPQHLLLEQFEQLPILLCSSVSSRFTPAGDSVVTTVSTRSLDKRSGKLLYNRDTGGMGDPYHTLRLEPHRGVIDLLSTRQRLRHTLTR